MPKLGTARILATLLVIGPVGSACGGTDSAVGAVEGRADAGGGPLEGSTVTLWAAALGDSGQLGADWRRLIEELG